MRTMQVRLMAVLLVVTFAMMLAVGDKAPAQSPLWTNIQSEEPGSWNSSAPSLRHLELRIRDMRPEGVEEYHFLPFEAPEKPVPENWC